MLLRSLKVAVIGAGVSGLAAARELRREHHQVVIFEKGAQIGGTWAYDPRVEADPLSLEPTREVVHSSLYLSLRTNLPRQLMSFSDYPFRTKEQGDSRTFPGHQEVLSFLNDFARDFGLFELIRFGAEVIRVEGVDGGKEEWIVEWKTRESFETSKQVFDAVIVCNGHFTEPRIAEIQENDRDGGRQRREGERREEGRKRKREENEVGGEEDQALVILLCRWREDVLKKLKNGDDALFMVSDCK